MSSSAIPAIGRVSHVDYGMSLLNEALVRDTSRAPYLLARFAIGHFGHPNFGKYSVLAFDQLLEGHASETLVPPLSDFVKDEIEVFVEETNNNGCGDNNLAAFVLLNCAIDEGSTPRSQNG